MAHRTVVPPLLLATAIALLLPGCSLLPDPLPTNRPDASSSPSQSPSESPAPSTSPSTTPSTTPSSEPEPEPDPSNASKPDLADLHLTTEGLGSLRIGRPVTASGMAEYDPDFCEGVSENPGDPANGRWVSTYGGDTFGVDVTADVVSGIAVRQADIRTPGGVGVGSTVDDLTTAHPEAQQVPLTAGLRLTDVWVLRGPIGQTVFEVANDSQPGYFHPEEIGTVVTLRTSPHGIGEFSTWGSDNAVGGCL
jgi:hypothetical protein